MRSALAASLLLVAGSAAAQQLPEPIPGQELLEQAVAAFQQGDYQVALEKFSEAHELVPRAEIAFNIGMCLERLGRLREAMIAYEEALASEELSAEGRARAQAQLDGLRPRLATVRVTEPVGAAVQIGTADRCEIPCSLVVDPGTHVVVLHDGETPRSQRITLAPGGEEIVRFGPRVSAEVVAPRGRARPSEDGGYAPGVLGVVGAGLVVAGGAGIVGFGLRTDALHEEYVANPTAETADEGETMMLLANASIGVAIVGGALALIDLLTQL